MFKCLVAATVVEQARALSLKPETDEISSPPPLEVGGPSRLRDAPQPNEHENEIISPTKPRHLGFRLVKKLKERQLADDEDDEHETDMSISVGNQNLVENGCRQNDWTYGETVLVSALLTITLAYLTIWLTPTIHLGIENSSMVLETASSVLQTIVGSLPGFIDVALGMTLYIAPIMIPPAFVVVAMLILNLCCMGAQFLLRKVGLLPEGPKEPDSDILGID